MLALTILLGTALAGYGDPVDGVPSPLERELHAWTNVARVDVSTFADALPCWGQVTSRQRAPHAALAWHPDLAAAARAHNEDMARNDHFSHDSTDGTSFEERVSGYYRGVAVGENLAYVPGGPKDAVLGWLCSAGHRENLLLDEFQELGTGARSPYWTQDFGSRGRAGPALRMGAHHPTAPSGRVTLRVDVEGDGPPRSVDAVLDGAWIAMDVLAGTPERGAWSVDADVGAGCHVYWFEAELADGSEARFPEEGGYGFGSCAWDDEGAKWVGPGKVAKITGEPYDPDGGGDDDDDRPSRRGCAVVDGPAGALALAGLIGVLGRRRRR